MALVLQPTTMNISRTSNTTSTSTSSATEKDLMNLQPPHVNHHHQPQHVVCHLAKSAADATTSDNKRPLRSSSASASATSSTSKPAAKRQRTLSSTSTSPSPCGKHTKRCVRFQAEVERRTFAIDYDNDDVWWSNEESKEHMERQSSLLSFYANNCADLVDSVMLVWVHCAEEALADGNYCMTMEQRSQLAVKVAQSPVRGFEKELATELITEQRFKTIGGLMELQAMCKRADASVTQDERVEAMAAASKAFSQTATIFAQTVAKADARVAKQHCADINISHSLSSS